VSDSPSPVPLPTRTPPLVKWLLNERAALLGQAERVLKRAQHLRAKVQQHEAVLNDLRKELEAAVAREQALRHGAAALQSSLELAEPRVCPDCVAPVRPWAGRYGKQGALKQFIRDTLAAAAPAPLSGAELKRRVIVKFSLDVRTPQERRSVKESIQSALHSLKDRDGVVERESFGPQQSLWRWKPDLDFAQLQQQASSALTRHEPTHPDPLRPQVGSQRAGRHPRRD